MAKSQRSLGESHACNTYTLVSAIRGRCLLEEVKNVMPLSRCWLRKQTEAFKMDYDVDSAELGTFPKVFNRV